jgi:hypothetical protein
MPFRFAYFVRYLNFTASSVIVPALDPGRSYNPRECFANARPRVLSPIISIRFNFLCSLTQIHVTLNGRADWRNRSCQPDFHRWIANSRLRDCAGNSRPYGAFRVGLVVSLNNLVIFRRLVRLRDKLASLNKACQISTFRLRQPGSRAYATGKYESINHA